MAKKRNTLNLNKITKRNQRKKRKYFYAFLKITGIIIGLFTVLYLGYFTAGLLFVDKTDSHIVTSEKNETIIPTQEDKFKDLKTVSIYIPAKKIIDNSYKDIISQAKNKGFTNVILELKDSDGYIYYETSCEEVINSKAVHKNPIKISEIVELVQKYGMTLSVKLSAFKDNIYPSYNQKAAVCINEGMTWLDSQYKRWINPYSAEGVKYIESICNELSNKYNISEILLSDVAFVSNGKTHLINYEKESQSASKEKVLVDFINNLKKTVNDDTKVGLIEDSYYLYEDVTNEKNGITKNVLLSGDFVCPIINPSLAQTHLPLILDGNIIEDAEEDLYKTVDLIYNSVKNSNSSKCYIKPVIQGFDLNSRKISKEDMDRQINALKDNNQEHYVVFSIDGNIDFNLFS